MSEVVQLAQWVLTAAGGIADLMDASHGIVAMVTLLGMVRIGAKWGLWCRLRRLFHARTATARRRVPRHLRPRGGVRCTRAAGRYTARRST